MYRYSGIYNKTELYFIAGNLQCAEIYCAAVLDVQTVMLIEEGGALEEIRSLLDSNIPVMFESEDDIGIAYTLRGRYYFAYNGRILFGYRSFKHFAADLTHYTIKHNLIFT